MEEKLKFFDFCSGIGGGRIGMEEVGFECVGHSEIDLNTAKTYEKFFNDSRNYGDLTKIDLKELPEFDIMIAGFPCQTFSIAGKREGFEDNRGLIIYSLIKIMKTKNVKYFLLENVKGLLNHDKGKTLRIIKNELEKAGYNLYTKVLNSINFGVPQMRERIYLVGFRKDLDNYTFEFPIEENIIYNLENYIDTENVSELDKNNETFNKYLKNKYNKEKNYKIEDILTWENSIIDYRQSDLRRYNGYFPTLRTGRHGLLYIKNKKMLRLNGYEALLLQGFPKEMAEIVKKDKFFINNTVLSQAGNAMTVNVIKKIAEKMNEAIKNKERFFNGKLFG
jgi:DNA (cytosine-5-)-methyltransferase